MCKSYVLHFLICFFLSHVSLLYAFGQFIVNATTPGPPLGDTTTPLQLVQLTSASQSSEMPRPPSLQHCCTTTTRMRPFCQTTMTKAYEDQHPAELMLSISSEQLEERNLPPGWQAYRNEEENKVVYFNEATNTSEYNFHNIFTKPKSKNTTTTNHPGGDSNNNLPRHCMSAAQMDTPLSQLCIPLS
jgi:hypothetical protein